MDIIAPKLLYQRFKNVFENLVDKSHSLDADLYADRETVCLREIGETEKEPSFREREQ
jgi:hypothetical protein